MADTKYETLPNYPADTVAPPPMPTRVARQPATTPLPHTNWFQRHEPLVIGVAAVVVFMLAWHGVATARLVSKLFLPGPVDVVEAFGDLVKGGELAQDLAVSAQEFSIGYLLASFTAIPLGLLLGWYPRVRYALDPFVTFLYATPRIVLLPLFIIWLGIGVESKIAVIYLGAFFAIL